MYFPHKSEEDSVEKEVVVAVNGLESKVVFIDHQHGAMKLENLVMTYDPHAFLVVLAVDDTSSLATVSNDLSDDGLFDLFQAERLLAGLVSSSSLAGRATILVANKTDLVRLSISSIVSSLTFFLAIKVIRTREVKTAVGKQLAVKYNVKYIETSPGEISYKPFNKGHL